MTYTTEVAHSASFSDRLSIEETSTSWEGELIETVASFLETIETYIDIRTAIEAQNLYKEQGRNAFVSFDDLRASAK